MDEKEYMACPDYAKRKLGRCEGALPIDDSEYLKELAETMRKDRCVYCPKFVEDTETNADIKKEQRSWGRGMGMR